MDLAQRRAKISRLSAKNPKAPPKKVVALKSIVKLNREEPGTLYLELRIWWFVL